MSTTRLLPCIDPNPDISGVGVRVSIYIQAFFNIVCAIIFSRDTCISNFEHTILTTTSLNLFLMGCALLLSTIIQGSTLGLTVHHTLIVLNLNWIVGLSALLYVFIWAYNGIAAFFNMPVKSKFRSFDDDDFDTVDETPSGKSLVCLSTIHLCATGAVGIWVWKTVKTFGDQQACTPSTILTVFGRSVSVLDATLRRASLAIYWMAVLPFVNLFVVFLAALVVIGLMVFLYGFIRLFGKLSWRTFSLFGGILVITLLEISFIVDTEIMISRPRMEPLVKEGEEQWTFGQTLALVTLIVPLVETAKMVFRAHNSERSKTHRWSRPCKASQQAGRLGAR